jgi:transcriptional regulator with XRE-family HTH domain
MRPFAKLCARPHVPRDQKKPTAAKKRRNHVGPQVRRLRSVNQWSQADLAAACQLHGWDAGRDIVARIESGLRQITDHELIVLAHVLGTTVAELIGETPLTSDPGKLREQLAARRALRAGKALPDLLPPS